jgi:hypothetical protein
MNAKRIILLFLIITNVSCEDKPAWQKEGWTIDQFQPESLEISKAKLEGNSILLTPELLIEIKGEPSKITEGCADLGIIPRQARIVYDCWDYGENYKIGYYILGETAYLSYLNFENKNLILKTPKINLSYKTKLTDLKKLFPNSYSNRNIGAASFPRDEYEWVYLNDDLFVTSQITPSKVELIFKKGNLSHFLYTQQPKYTSEQMEVYINWRKEINQTNK